MKKGIIFVLLVVMLSGCRQNSGQMKQALEIRQKLLNCKGCQFQTVITADYGDKIYEFSLDCTVDEEGTLTFLVKEPETIAGITGTVSQKGGALTFDGKALAFETIADGYVTPVAAPWLLIKTLRSGYITATGNDGDNRRVTVDDSYAENDLTLDIWINSQNVPLRGEILWQGKRILTLDVRSFVYL